MKVLLNLYEIAQWNLRLLVFFLLKDKRFITRVKTCWTFLVNHLTIFNLFKLANNSLSNPIKKQTKPAENCRQRTGTIN